MVKYINHFKENGQAKTKKEMAEEMNILLTAYRRHNLILNDRIFDILNNVLPAKDKAIEDLNSIIKKITTQLENNKPWII